MTYYPVQSPYTIFTDEDGTPLESGYIYIGEPNQNPITNPIDIFWDVDGLYPAAQPIRTIAGYPSNNGTPSNFFADLTNYDDYSILIKDKKLNTVTYDKSYISSTIVGSIASVDTIADLRILNGGLKPIYVRSHTTIGVGGGGYFEWIDGAAPATYTDNNGTVIVPTAGDGSGAWFRQYDNSNIDVRFFGALGGTNDDTAAIQAAHDSLPTPGGTLIFPAIYAASKQFTITDKIDITKPGVTIKGSTSSNLDSIKILYNGVQDDTLSMFLCSIAADGFAAHNLFLDANDLAGYCIYQTGETSPSGLTRPGDFQNMSFRGYRSKAWVIGDHTDVLNDAQFQVINARNIYLGGGALNLNADGIHLNAQNCEFLNINGIYIDPPSSGRHHTNHFRQIAGGLNINGMVSTRAGTTTLTADYAIYSQDQLIVRGWRSEDRMLVNTAAATVRAPCELQDVIQRDVSLTAGTSGTDQVIILNQIDGTVKLNNIQVQGSIAIGATDARRVSADVYFGILNAAGTKGSFIFNGPQNQRGLFHDVDVGLLTLRGTTPELNFTQEDGTSLYSLSDGSVLAPRVNTTQITADQNAWDLGPGFFFRISSDAARNINGMVGNDSGRIIRMANVGSFNIVFINQSGAATSASYRFLNVTGANITLAPNEVMESHYDTATSRWRSWKY